MVGGRRDTWVPPYTHFCRAGPVYPAGGAGKLDSGRCRHRPLRKRILWCVGEGLSCPPLCRPIPGHCRARQSGHFLETGLLHPPLAALRRFPLPRATARVAPTEGYKRCGGVKNPPVTALPCQPPLGKGPRGRGRRIATTSLRTGLAMTGLCKRCGVRDDVGSELSAASGRSSEVSEWPRSKFPASAVRQRRNFGHRNRIIVPYGCVAGSAVRWATARVAPTEKGFP